MGAVRRVVLHRIARHPRRPSPLTVHCRGSVESRPGGREGGRPMRRVARHYLKSGGRVAGVKNSRRTSSTDTKRTSALYLRISGLITSQAG